MTLLKKTIISATTLCLSIVNITSLTFANPNIENHQIQKAINQTEAFVITDDIETQKKKLNISSEQIIIEYLNKLETASTFKLKCKENDEKDEQLIIRLQQYINNIPIYGSDIVACVDYSGNIKSISGYIEPAEATLEDFKYKLNITKEQAINIATNKLKATGKKDIESELYLYKNQDKYILAYKVDIKVLGKELYDQTMFIDAEHGNIIQQYENVKKIVRTNTTKAKGVFGDEKDIQVVYKEAEPNFNDGYYFIDKTRGATPIQTVDANNEYYTIYNMINSVDNYTKYYSTSLQQSDGKFVDAHYYAGKAYDFYYNKFSRDGLDGKGKKPVVFANVDIPGNAFSAQINGSDVLGFGNGDSYTYDSSGSIDVVGHEYTHSVVANTAGLEYVSQSGAIDEAYADIFGTLIEHSYKTDFNWVIGEDFLRNGYIIRDLSDPEIDHVSKLKVCSEYHVHNSSCDNNYVHDNSGVIGKLAYLISQGGIHYNVSVKGIGEERMGEIFYDALTEGLYSQSDFKHLGEVLLSKAQTTTEKETITNALKSVGIMPKYITTEIVGSTRYETATKISQNGWSTANSVVVVNSNSMVDALSATPFAKLKDAPILLTESNSLNDITKKEIIRLNAKNVYVIGGTSVISENVISQLKSMGLIVERISGDDRYKTSLEIAKRLGTISEISVVNGVTGLADAVSIAPVAASKNMPIVLASPKEGTSVFNEFIKSNKITTSYIIGSENAVSSVIANQLPNPKRLGGLNRDETNAVIIGNFYTSKELNNIFVAKDGMTKQDHLIDALSVGVLAAKESSPVVIVGNELCTKQKDLLLSKIPKELTKVGGNGNENAFNQLINIFK